jgi:hypothetical protein
MRCGLTADSRVSIAFAAHEYINRGIVVLRPRVDRNVTFREHGNAGDPAAIAKSVTMGMHYGRACRRRAAFQ